MKLVYAIHYTMMTMCLFGMFIAVGQDVAPQISTT